MTGYESKRAAAQAKTIDEVNWADHEPNGLAQPTQKCPNIKNCGGACFQCEYFNAEKGEMEYPVVQPEQEPVAWCSQCGHKCPLPAQEPDTYRSVPHGHCTHPRCKEVFSAYIEVNKRLAHYEPEGKSPMILNAAPSQRPWVELTNKEIEECNQFTSNNTTCIYLYKDDFEENGINFARAVLAKLKEKNT